MAHKLVSDYRQSKEYISKMTSFIVEVFQNLKMRLNTNLVGHH